jgi:hypothetical protein
VAGQFWAQIAVMLNSTIEEKPADLDERAARPLGKEYEVVVEIMGLGSAILLSTFEGQQVLSGFVDTVRREAGEGALILAVIERVSESVLKRVPDEDKAICLAYASILLRNLPKQMSRRVLDQGRQNLWPSSSSVKRNPDFDPYVHVYGAVVSVGLAAYQDLDSADIELVKSFIAALASSFHNCSTSQLTVYLRKTQDLVRVWIEDSERRMQSKEQPLKSLHREVSSINRSRCTESNIS